MICELTAMSIKITNLQFFVAVATSQSLTQAAQRVHRTPAAVSLSLKQLEEELGGALFEGERKTCSAPWAGLSCRRRNAS